MGFFQIKNNQKFDDAVEQLASYGLLTLSPSKILSFTPSQKKKLEELGFLFFTIVMYSTFCKDLAICKNKDYFKDKCLILFPDSDLLPLFKGGRALSDRVVYDLPRKGQEIKRETKTYLEANLKKKHPRLNQIRGLETWGNFYELTSSDLRYLVALGGLGFEINVDYRAVDIFITDFPSWESSQASHLLDTFLTIIKAGFYSDTSIYCANTELRKPFRSYELDSVLFKSSSASFGQARRSEDITRLVVTETSLCSDARDLLVKEADFIKSSAYQKGKIDYPKVKVNKDDYVPVDTANDTAFRNKLITYLAFKSSGVQNFGYIFFLLKFGLSDESFLRNMHLATTYYCLTRSLRLEVIEMDVQGECDYFESAIARSPLSKPKLYRPYRKMLRNYQEALSTFR